jgi:DNA-binding NtrC family response regulator
MKRSLLIVDDDPRVRASLPGAVKTEVAEVRVAEDAEQALAMMGSGPVDVVLTDVRMPGMDGLELLALLRERAPQVSVVLMTAYDDLPTVATAMREGAADFLVKPLELQQLRHVIRRVFEDREAAAAAREASSGNDSDRLEAVGSEALIGHDPAMIEVFKLVGRAAASRTNVVIRGESGTGKELVARAIHESSPYGDLPFVAVNCTALPSTLLESELFGHVRGAFTGASSDRKGRFALAGKGTILLDEIGDTSLDFQAKLLRVLQEHEFYPVGAERPERMEARVVAATHRDLERLVAEGEFREDLYYRLRVVEIFVPPLRDRPGDIPVLAEHLVRKASASAGRPAPALSDEALKALKTHTWPGNVRELENCLARAVVTATGHLIRPEHLEIRPREEGVGAMDTLEAMERDHVARVLKAAGGQKSTAAEVLGVSRPRLDRLIDKYGLSELAPGRRKVDAGGGDGEDRP